MLTVAIMCGGTGSRLWPLSTDETPKQFLKLTDVNYTMFQLTVIRNMKLKPNKLIAVCNQAHKDIVYKQIEELDINIEYQIVAEPLGKNTAAVIATCCVLSDIEDIILVVPSDHLFDDDIYIKSISEGLVNKDSITVFGIKPTYPETGYGYIKRNGNKLDKFVEKPNKETAQKYMNEGYLWNSGLFMFGCKIMRDKFEKHAADIMEQIAITVFNSYRKDNIIILNKIAFDKVRDESIDYAIMEYVDDGSVIDYNGSWSDIGSYESLHKILPKDSNNNYLQGSVTTLNTTNSYINTTGKKRVATIGLDNVAIVETDDTILIINQKCSQQVKKIYTTIKTNKSLEL